MVEKFTSIREVISKVYRDLRLDDESRWQDMVEWGAEALEQIGSYGQLERMNVVIEVENYRYAVPCELHKVIGMSYNGSALRYLNGSFDMAQNADDNNLQMSLSAVGYNMNNSYFNFNFKEGEVKLSYLAVPTDEDGFPLIPDDISFKEAIEKYIVMKLRYGDFINEQINPNTWDRIVNDWHWYCSQARGSANMPNLDEAESIKNMWNRLMPRMNEHKHHFSNITNRERITK